MLRLRSGLCLATMAALTSSVAGCGRRSAAAPANAPTPNAATTKWTHRNEEQWIVTEIAGAIAALSTYARHPGKPAAADWSVRVVSAKDSRNLTDAFKPLRVRLAIGTAAEERDVDITDHLFSAAAYVPLAKTLLPPGISTSQTTSDPDQKLLATLLDLRAAVLVAESRRVSAALEADPFSASAHEQAALVLGAFGLRDPAACNSDARPVLSRMTAHLAVARALRAGSESGLAGKYAEVALLSLVERQRESLDRLEALTRSAATAPEHAWLRALRVRITGDYRILPVAKGASLVEQLERFRARASRLSTQVTSQELETLDASLPDWGRITFAIATTVTDCGQFGHSAVAGESAELAVVRKAMGQPALETPEDMVEALDERPAGGGVQLKGGHLSFSVLDSGLWAAFLQRGLIDALSEEHHCLAHVWGLPEEAVSHAGETRKQFSRLTLFPLIARQLVHDKGDEDRGFEAAVELARREPERVSAALWTALRNDGHFPFVRDTFPDEALWFSTGLPRGTAYEATKRLHHLKGLHIVTPENKTALRDIAPFNSWVAWSRIWRLGDASPNLELVQREGGPLLEYDAAFLFQVAYNWRNDLNLYKPIGRKLCELNPAEWPWYGDTLVALGDEEAALAAFREMLTKTPDEVQIAWHIGWLVDHEFERGHPEEALRFAQRAAATCAGAGLAVMSRLLERMGRLEEGFRYARDLQERYHERLDMVSFYLRHREHFKGSKIQAHAEPIVKDMFPNDLERVTLADFREAPKDGAVFKGTSDHLVEAGLKEGAVVVALDGIRVHNGEQYQCVKALSSAPLLHVIAWQDAHYKEVAPTLKNRLFGVELGSYQPR